MSASWHGRVRSTDTMRGAEKDRDGDLNSRWTTLHPYSTPIAEAQHWKAPIF
jgi:hypothetical protein